MESKLKVDRINSEPIEELSFKYHSSERTKQDSNKSLKIEFLYLDLSVCDRCKGTEKSLNAAISEARRKLKGMNIDVKVDKIQVTTEEQAQKVDFAISPTIRINGKDIQPRFKQSRCLSCGNICCSKDEVVCRVWVYEDKEYTVPPKAMIFDAILREAYGLKKDSASFKSSEGKALLKMSTYFNGKDLQGSQAHGVEDFQDKEINNCCSDIDSCCA